MTRYQNMIFLHLLSERGLKPTQEYKFHPERRWLFDYAFPERLLAVEVEGGIYNGKAHGSISGIKRDIEKYSEAAAYGWRIVRVLPEDIGKKKTIDLIFRAYNATEWILGE